MHPWLSTVRAIMATKGLLFCLLAVFVPQAAAQSGFLLTCWGRLFTQ